MEKKTLHFISHTHWDREWYMPFEAHRYRLVEFFDTLLDTLDNDPTFKSFHLDGQAIVIEDYLEVRPEMREKIEKYIAEGRLVSGPWYILQDEYLVDGESNVRNMLVGRQVAAKYGKVSDVGYFPDAFGNIGQAPQILRGFGIDTVAFGRGTSPRKGDRFDTGEENYGKWVSEIKWRSPDGSEVLGAVFLRWYNNGSEIPSDPEKAVERINAIRNSAAEVATTPHLLLMNGCDHQPVQTDIGQIIDKLNKTYPDELVHSNFHDYFEAIRPYSDRFGIFIGELAGEYSSGWDTLANTASARIYIKQYNARCETLLEKRVEPMSVLSHIYAGDKIRRDYFMFMWKTLLQNHPHDSICGCSVDEVNAEMVTRFRKVLAAGGKLNERQRNEFIAVLDTASTGADYAVTVFNPMGFVCTEAAKFNLDLPEDTAVTSDMIAVYDGENRIPCDVEDIGVVFDYILPDDRFRIPFHTHRFAVTFRASEVPAAGFKTFAVKTDADANISSDVSVSGHTMANANLRVTIRPDGSAAVINRRGGKYLTGIMVDTGDLGDEYFYRQTKDGITVTTEGHKAAIELVRNSAASAEFKVTHKMKIPADADRKTGLRTGECVLVVENYFTLRAGSDRLDIRTVIHNNAKNHRLVVQTKSGIETETVMAEGQFDIVKRVIKPWDGWTNPTKPERMTSFFGLEDEKRGLLIAGRGLNEYEVLRDGENTMQLTIHRGIDQLGDWGWFPTPEAQCLGDLEVEYALVPYVRTKNDRERAVNSAYSFAGYMPEAYCAKAHAGEVSPSGSPFGLSGNGFVLSAVKMAEDRDSVIVRIFNPYEYDTKAEFTLGDRFSSAYEANLAEERGAKLHRHNGAYVASVPSKKIVTIELVPAK